jgi:hypothetical protein
MRMSVPDVPSSSPVQIQPGRSPSIQNKRKCARCEEEEKVLQKKSDSPSSSRQSPHAEAPSLVHQVLSSPGQPLVAPNLSFFQSRFGFDFSSVRVHTDARAAESAGAVKARAYTVGHDIVFGPCEYAPSTTKGKRLLAHELVHVVQQSQTTVGEQARYSPITLRGLPSPTSALQRQVFSPPTAPVSEPEKVIPGNTELSKIAQDYRRRNPGLPPTTNLAVAEYSIGNESQRLTKVTENSELVHSEENMEQFLRGLREERGKEIKVHEIYSERQFCGPREHNCEKLVLANPYFKYAKKTFGYDYQDAGPRFPGGGPYRASATKTRLQKSHERLSTTQNLEWDFEARQTQPYSARGGPPPKGSEGSPPFKTPKIDTKKALRAIKPGTGGSGLSGALKGVAALAALGFLDSLLKRFIESNAIEQKTEAQIIALQPAIEALVAASPKQIYAVINVTVTTSSHDVIVEGGIEEKTGMPVVSVEVTLAEHAVEPTNKEISETIVSGMTSLEIKSSTYSVLLLDVEKEQARQEIEAKEERLRTRQLALAEENRSRVQTGPIPNQAAVPPTSAAAPRNLLPAAPTPPTSFLPGAPERGLDQEAYAVYARGFGNQLLAQGFRLQNNSSSVKDRDTFKLQVQVWRGQMQKLMRDFGNPHAKVLLTTTLSEFDGLLNPIAMKLGISGWKDE